MWQYCKDIPAVDNNNAIVNFAENNATDSFNFKVKMTGQTGNDGTKNVEIMVPPKYLSNFWRTLEMSLINCEINLTLTWSTNCVIVSNSEDETNFPQKLLLTNRQVANLRKAFAKHTSANINLSKTQLS